MSFVLHHRWVPSAPSGDSTDTPVAFVLHGALGSGQNFRRFVQRLATTLPNYRFLLVDLRCHGDSGGAIGPHTLATCAKDLEVLARHLNVSPRVLIGHSFGGKVAMQFALHAEQSKLPGAAKLEQIWVLDSVPGAQAETEDSEVSHVIRAVRSVPMPAQSRKEVVDHLTQSASLPGGLAEWMATNLKREGALYHWRFDLDGIEELMVDYFKVDLWGYLEQSRVFPQIELVIAERSSRWTKAFRARAAALGPETKVKVHSLNNAGHWVHVDNPNGLLEMMAEFQV